MSKADRVKDAIYEEAQERCDFPLRGQDLDIGEVTMGGCDPLNRAVEESAADEIREELRGRREQAEELLVRNLQTLMATGDVPEIDGEEARAALHRYRHERGVLYHAKILRLGERLHRSQVDLSPPSGMGPTFMMGAKLATVSGARMAEYMGFAGGTAFVSQFQRYTRPHSYVGEYLHSKNPDFSTAVTVTMNTRLSDCREWMDGRGVKDAIVVDDPKTKRMTGIIHNSPETPIFHYNTPDSTIADVKGLIRTGNITALEIEKDPSTEKYSKINQQEAFKTLRRANCGILPVIDKTSKEVLGMVTRKSATMRMMFQPRLSQRYGGFFFLPTISLIHDVQANVTAMLEAGADAICLDTALVAYGGLPFENIEMAARIRDEFDSDKGDEYKTPIIVSNMTNIWDVFNCAAAGANFVVGGIGGGGSCSTWDGNKVGRPMFTTAVEMAGAAKAAGIHLIVDGGFSSSDRIAIGAAVGADQVMSASSLGSCHETPQPFMYDIHGKKLGKWIWGEASAMAVMLRSLGHDKDTIKAMVAEAFGYNAEGVRNFVQVEVGRESVHDIQMEAHRRMQAVLTYHGCKNIRELHQRARFHRLTPRPRGRSGTVHSDGRQ